MTNYTGLGVYRPQPPPRRRILLITALAAATIMLASAGTLAFLTQRPPTIHGIARPAAAAATTARPKPLTPRTLGWQTTSSLAYHIAYDIPNVQWTLLSAFYVEAANPGRFKVSGGGSAAYQQNYCTAHPEGFSAHAVTAVVTRNDWVDSRATTAPEVAGDWARAVYVEYQGQTTAPEVTLEPQRAVKVDDGTLDAALAIADVTVHSTDPCAPKTATVYAVARPDRENQNEGVPITLVLLADQGVPGALSEADAMKILTSMRPDQ